MTMIVEDENITINMTILKVCEQSANFHLHK